MSHVPTFSRIATRLGVIVRLALLFVLVEAVAIVSTPVTAAGATSPTLGAVASYSILAGSIVTNTGKTTMPGNLGISPSIGVPPHYTGFPPGIVGQPGTIHDADASAAAAQADDTAAFGTLDQGCTHTYAGVQNLTLVSPLGPGVYCADAFLLTGNLTLSGSGVWIFKSAATLTTSSGSSVTGGDPCNVWWRLVSSGTIGTGTTFLGNILASTSITLQTGASLNGRALAQTGQVTLDTNHILGPVCAAPPTAVPPTAVPSTVTFPIVRPTTSFVSAPVSTVSSSSTLTAFSSGSPITASRLPLTGYPPADVPDNRLPIMLTGGLIVLAAGLWTFNRAKKRP